MRIYFPAVLCLLVGCSDLVSGNPSGNEPLRVRTTNDIGEFRGNSPVVQPDVNISNPITGPLEAYEPITQQLAQLGIEHAVQMFHAMKGRYPKNYDEFMQRVIRTNQIRLPKPGRGFRYEYDVDNHKLVIVKDPTDAPQ